LFSGGGGGGSGTGQSPPKRDSATFSRDRDRVVDDRDGYASTHEGRGVREREGRAGTGEREKDGSGRDARDGSGRKEKKHERWLPRALGMGGKIARPATSLS
jgi:hypothetical protein